MSSNFKFTTHCGPFARGSVASAEQIESVGVKADDLQRRGIVEPATEKDGQPGEAVDPSFVVNHAANDELSDAANKARIEARLRADEWARKTDAERSAEAARMTNENAAAIADRNERRSKEQADANADAAAKPAKPAAANPQQQGKPANPPGKAGAEHDHAPKK